MKTVKFLMITMVALFWACQEKQVEVVKTIDASLRGQVVDSLEKTNNFYDNVETHSLKGGDIMVEGEVENPGKVDFSKLVKRSLIVKETLLTDSGDEFVGAYRYDGYSLFDILSHSVLDKKNEDHFRPIIDLYVEIENDKGEKVVVSWGELFYPSNLHQIIVATEVARIVPSKTDDLWPLPTDIKLVFGADLFTERNISNPVKITVKSFDAEFEVNKGMKPMYAPEVAFYNQGELVETLKAYPNDMEETTLHTIFYGRGRGIHSTQPFSGIQFKEYLKTQTAITKENIQTGYVLFVARDGYRCYYSYSEICNRNDQQDVLLIHRPEQDHGGAFRLFPSADFFSDRAVKSVDRIYYSNK